jgi:cytochrome c553
MIRIFRLAFVFTLALFVYGSNPALAEAVSEEELTAVAGNMHEQLARISIIKSAIVAGRLTDVREPATWLADHEIVPGLPADFEPFIAQLRTYARHLIEAQNLESAAIAVSRMARTCGNCHVANDVELEFGYDRAPRSDLEDIVTHMQRHQWAVDRLWDGIIGPSERAWNRGADMLIDVPLEAEDVTTVTAHFKQVSDLAGRIHELGRIGSETTAPDARSDLYAEVLGLCADCHVMLGRGPAGL